MSRRPALSLLVIAVLLMSHACDREAPAKVAVPPGLPSAPQPAAEEPTEGGRSASQIKRAYCDELVRKLADKPSLAVLVGLKADPLDEPAVVAARSAVLAALPPGSATDIQPIGAALSLQATAPAVHALCASAYVTTVREPEVVEPGAAPAAP